VTDGLTTAATSLITTNITLVLIANVLAWERDVFDDKLQRRPKRRAM
jgi:hypothetical protein